jgi:hypothetical protein
VLISRFFNHVGSGAPGPQRDNRSARLTFSLGNAWLPCSLLGSGVNQGEFPMTFMGPIVGRLSILAAYVAIAFVGAIVLGVF